MTSSTGYRRPQVGHTFLRGREHKWDYLMRFAVVDGDRTT